MGHGCFRPAAALGEPGGSQKKTKVNEKASRAASAWMLHVQQAGLLVGCSSPKMMGMVW